MLGQDAGVLRAALDGDPRGIVRVGLLRERGVAGRPVAVGLGEVRHGGEVLAPELEDAVGLADGRGEHRGVGLAAHRRAIHGEQELLLHGGEHPTLHVSGVAPLQVRTAATLGGGVGPRPSQATVWLVPLIPSAAVWASKAQTFTVPCAAVCQYGTSSTHLVEAAVSHLFTLGDRAEDVARLDVGLRFVLADGVDAPVLGPPPGARGSPHGVTAWERGRVELHVAGVELDVADVAPQEVHVKAPAPLPEGVAVDDEVEGLGGARPRRRAPRTPRWWGPAAADQG